jgi:DNA-binding transcriptional LysR family regulator
MPHGYGFSMELRHLRYFQAVGREEHFGRAAARLHVAQPALTRQIRDLERELGIALFERLPRGVRLSSAGKIFLEDATDILAQVEHAAGRARGFASGRLGTVRVGFSELASGDYHVPQGLLDFRTTEPGVTLSLAPMGSVMQVDAVKAGRLDMAIVYDIHHEPEDLQVLDCRAIGVTDIVLAVYKGHPLATQKAISLKDLAGEPMLWPLREAAATYYDALMGQCLAHGVSPHIVQETATHSILLSLVSVGMGLGFIGSSANLTQSSNVVLRRISDLNLSFRIHLLWRKSDPSPALARLVEVLSAPQASGQAAAAIA